MDVFIFFFIDILSTTPLASRGSVLEGLEKYLKTIPRLKSENIIALNHHRTYKENSIGSVVIEIVSFRHKKNFDYPLSKNVDWGSHSSKNTQY